MSFKEIPHTADVKIRGHAPTLEALFSDAANALMQVMFGNRRGKGTQKEVYLESSDPETMLCDFLSEILFISEVESLVFSKALVQISGTSLHAVLDGEPFDPARHYGGTEVKGISYSGLSITTDEDGYILDIIFDV